MTRSVSPARLALGSSSCSRSIARCSRRAPSFGIEPPNPPRLVVDARRRWRRSAPVDAPLDLLIDTPLTFRVNVGARRQRRRRSTPTFNRYVRISSKPGAIDPLDGPDTDGRNVLLTDGESVAVRRSRSRTRTARRTSSADDLGYMPRIRSPTRRRSARTASTTTATARSTSPPTRAAPSPTTTPRTGGTYARARARRSTSGCRASPTSAGSSATPALGCSGNGATPYPRQQILRRHRVPRRRQRLRVRHRRHAHRVRRLLRHRPRRPERHAAGRPASTASSRSTSTRRRSCACAIA